MERANAGRGSPDTDADADPDEDFEFVPTMQTLRRPSPIFKMVGFFNLVTTTNQLGHISEVLLVSAIDFYVEDSVFPLKRGDVDQLGSEHEG